MASLVAWMPDAQTVLADLSYLPPVALDEHYVGLESWKGMQLRWRNVGAAEGGSFFFSGTYWSRATAQHWEIPLVAVAAYVVMIPLLKRLVAHRGKFDVRSFAFYWNAMLSLFSWCGVAACVPVLTTSLWEHGLYFTMCAPAAWYASGWSGLFVALFIYSKIAELVDTVLLLLAGKPVIALQWWHHSTVLLYCWHSYSVRIATGAWFACMNYSVHSMMYGYFAVMGTKHRKVVAPYAIYITLLQLVQMLVGMFVTIKAVQHQAEGDECHVNKTNSILGLAMYASYFVLFFKLFIDNYYLRPKGQKRQRSVREVARSMSRKITQSVEAEADDLDEGASPEIALEEPAVKKLN
jgi:elongation of very long chain fatty acids protein 6